MNVFESPYLENQKSVLLAEIPAIQESRNKMIIHREEIASLVEKPLLIACETLWDKNIRTLSTSANQKDIETGEAYIIIDFDHLSEQNQEVAQKYAQPIMYDGIRAVKIIIPVTNASDYNSINDAATEIVTSFYAQTANWIPHYTLNLLKKSYGIPEDNTNFNDPSKWEDYYYDPDEEVFYLSKEHYKKAVENTS